MAPQLQRLIAQCKVYLLSLASMALRKRKILTLEERVSVLSKIEKGQSCRSVAEELGVGKTQIQNIVKDKEDILKQWAAGESSSKKYTKVRKTGYEEIDKVVWEWFTRARAKNIPVTGRLIQERAIMYASELGIDQFAGSNGWLEKWQKRHNVRMVVLSGEAADVDPTVVSDWSERLKTICQGYALKGIFNADETGLFYRALPTRSMAVKGVKTSGGKKSKERITVLLACSAIGEKLTPFVIGHSERPRCFRGHLCLPVTYTSNRKAWMTSGLFESWLDKVNNKLKAESRSILLFVDNCTAHPDVLQSNVKLVFLPPNTTSKLQPCDAGIIQNVKLRYRKQLLRHIINRMDDSSCASELAKSVNVLDAIMWLKSAWDAVKEVTIERCFAKCGFVDTLVGEDEPADAEFSSEMESLLDQVGASITLEEYANCDQELDICQPLEKDWEENLLATLREEESSAVLEDEADMEAADPNNMPVVTVKTAATYLQELRDFAMAQESPELLELITRSQTIVEETMFKKATKQTKITDYVEK